MTPWAEAALEQNPNPAALQAHLDQSIFYSFIGDDARELLLSTAADSRNALTPTALKDGSYWLEVAIPDGFAGFIGDVLDGQLMGHILYDEDGQVCRHPRPICMTFSGPDTGMWFYDRLPPSKDELQVLVLILKLLAASARRQAVMQ